MEYVIMIYGKVGSSEQIIDDSNNPIVPDGFIEIKETRPDLNYRLNTKGKWEEFTPIPDKITKRQAMLQLNKAGLYQSVLDMINASDNISLKIEYDCSTEFERQSPFILGMAKEMSLTDEVVDNLFIEAANL